MGTCTARTGLQGVGRDRIEMVMRDGVLPPYLDMGMRAHPSG